MGKFFDAIIEAGFAKLFWFAVALVCFFLGGIMDGFLPGLAGRLGYASLGIFVYININVFIKYYTLLRGVIGWPEDIAKEEMENNPTNFN